MADVSVLNVLLYGQPVGTLTRLPDDRIIFAFDDDYIRDENRPVLSLGFKDKLGQLITAFRPYQTRVMPYFSNLLPEGHMRRYLAERAGVNSEREFFLLWVLGQDLPGAITIVPADGEAWPPEANGDAAGPRTGDHRDTALRFSLAGVQLKFSAINENTGGLTIPAKGIGGSAIVKLPSREFAQVPENEFSMMTLARLVGIDVPPVRLVAVRDIGNLPGGIGTFDGDALVIERFDRRPDGGTVHIEDFAQIFGLYPQDKYKKASVVNIANVIAAEAGQGDTVEFIRRLTFNTLIGNADMHVKNWSMIYPDRRHAALAPAYDFVSTIAYIPDESAGLRFSRTRRFDGFSEDELAHLAAWAHLPETLVLASAKETVALFHQHWAAEKRNLPLAATVVRAIDAHTATIPLA